MNLQNDVVIFEFVLLGKKETFKAQTSDSALIKKARNELLIPLKKRTLHINGKLELGSDINLPWSWHIKEDEWDLVEISAEICDAWPSYIEANLATWMKEVGYFCPWSSRISQELKKV